jgi:RHS repeat-associated protein
MSGGFGWGTYVATSRFDAYGRLGYMDLGNTYGTVVSYEYEDGTNRLTRLGLDRERIGGTELDLRYAYDPAGNVLSVKDVPNTFGKAADKQCFAYDALRRLTEAWTPGTGDCALARSIPGLGGAAPYWNSWEYDGLGNRTSETHRTRGQDGGLVTTTDYAYAGSRDLDGDGNTTDAGEFAGPHAVTGLEVTSNAATSAGTAKSSYTYDKAGRALSQTTSTDYERVARSLTWDRESELAGVSTATTVWPEPEPGSGTDDGAGDPGGDPDAPDSDLGPGTTTTAELSNLYTADGDRLLRTAPDGSITLYVGGQEVTKSASGQVSAVRYYSFAGQTVAMRTAPGLGGVTSLVNDPHGTPVASVHNTDWTTTSVNKHYTLPFGGSRGGAQMPGDRAFLGKTKDPATGLTLVGARWYDEAAGRFISVDPIMDLASPQQWNGYAYANNNPTTYGDPDGLEPRPWHQSGVGFSDLSQKVVDAYSSMDGWSTGWVAQTYSGPLTISSGYGPGTKINSLVNTAAQVKALDRHVQPVHTAGYTAMAGIFSSQTEQALGAASWLTPFADAAQAGLYLACLQKDCGAYENAAGGAAMSAAGALLPGGSITKHGDEVADAANTAAHACSFTGATLVLMADGSHKRIEDVEIGDEVIASDPETGEQESRKVTHIFVHEDTVKDLALEDGTVLGTTEDHPFWSVTDQKFERAEQLTVGEKVLTADGRTLTVGGLRSGTSRTALAYNLAVDGIHTYHVGQRDVLVHNVCPDRLFSGDGWQHALYEHVDGSPGVAANNTTFSNYLELDDIGDLIEDAASTAGRQNYPDPATGIARDGTIHTLDVGYPIGSRGETTIEVILNTNGSLRTAYPKP